MSEETVIPRSRAPLPTPRMATIHQEVESWTSCSTLSEPLGPAPMFNLHRANVQAVSSVSSFWEKMKVSSMMMSTNKLFTDCIR